MSDAHGVIQIHSCPPALAQHVAWTLSSALAVPVRPLWSEQPVERGTVRAELEWSGEHGTAARIASAMLGWADLRFEISEETAAGRDGVRYAHTPSLGIFYTLIDAAGNSMVNEDRVRYAIEIADGDIVELERELRLALGNAWDDEMEPYRAAQFAVVVPLARGSRAV
ncbi:MAG: DUF3145 family protein [Microbacteriaceae bacterium]